MSVSYYFEHLQKLSARPLGQTVLFCMLFSGICLFYGYQNTLTLPPSGLHQWRQSDGAALAWNYYQDGLNLFQPRILNLIDGNGKGVSEFPLIPYLAAIEYKLFGHHDFLYRFTLFLLFAGGIWSLYQLAFTVLEDVFFSLILSLLVFSSPVIAYYGNGFITEIPSMAFAAMGWYGIALWTKKQKNRHFYLAMVAFGFSGLCKIIGLVHPLIVLFIWLCERFLKINFGPKPIFRLKSGHLVSLSCSFLVTVAWYLWAIGYNQDSHSYYFLTQPNPVWSLTFEEIRTVFQYITDFWWNDYFYRRGFYFFPLLILIPILFWRHCNRFWASVCGLMLLGNLAFFLLWMGSFKDHDYYMINLALSPFLLAVLNLDTLKNRFKVNLATVPSSESPLKSRFHRFGILVKWPLKGFFCLLLMLSLRNSGQVVERRYLPSAEAVSRDYLTLFAKLPSLNIGIEAKVLCLPDPSSNVSLYFLKRRGWTMMYQDSPSVEFISEIIRKGAEFVFIDEEKMAQNGFQTALPSQISAEKIGQHGTISIYRVNSL